MVQHGRSFGTVGGDEIIRTGGGTHGLHGANGDHVGIVAGRGDGSITVIVVGIIAAVVARRHHHDYSGVPGLLDRLAQRIRGVALEYSPAQRQVDDADVVLTLEGNRLLD